MYLSSQPESLTLAYGSCWSKEEGDELTSDCIGRVQEIRPSFSFAVHESRTSAYGLSELIIDMKKRKYIRLTLTKTILPFGPF